MTKKIYLSVSELFISKIDQLSELIKSRTEGGPIFIDQYKR